METAERKQLGVIEALSAGFDLVMRRPWLLILPVALDLFLWIGPQARAKPIFDEIISLLTMSAATSGAPDAQASLDALKATLQLAGERFNLFSYVALFGLGMPTLSGVDAPPAWAPPVAFSIVDEPTMLGWLLLSALVGVFLGTIYLEGIARKIRHDSGGFRTFFPRVLKAYGTLLVLGLMVVGGALLVSIPFLIIAALVSMLSPGLALMALLAIWLIYVWVALYLAFAVPSVFVSGAGPAQSILNSIAVLRYNFWPAIGLIFLIILLETGFSVIWQQLAGETWGVVLAFALSALLGTGLIAGGMLFYHDRFTWLTEVRRRIHQHQRPTLKG